MYVWYPWRSEEDTGCPGTGIMDSYEPPCGCWESNPDPLQQQQVLLTTEPSLRAPKTVYFIHEEGERTKSESVKVHRVAEADSRQ